MSKNINALIVFVIGVFFQKKLVFCLGNLKIYMHFCYRNSTSFFHAISVFVLGECYALLIMVCIRKFEVKKLKTRKNMANRQLENRQ